MLCLEGKRSQRSGKPFLLMLIDAGEIRQELERDKVLRLIHSMRSLTLRETDVIGWYQRGLVLGIIFTETGETGIDHAKESIMQKVRDHLKHSLTHDQIEKLKITFQISGEDHFEPPTKCFTMTPYTCEFTGEQSPPLAKMFAQALADFFRQRWLMFLGDMALLFIAQVAGAWVRLGVSVDLATDYTGAFVFVLALTPVTLYVFDMYNMHRTFHSRSTAFRTPLAVLFMTGLCTVFFYLLPQWQYGRGVLAIQMILAALLLTGWRILYGFLFQASPARIPTLIVGAGESGMEVYKLLKSRFSPYVVKGFLDDDPLKQGAVMNSPAVVGTLDQIGEASRQMGIRTAVIALPRNRPCRLVRKIMEARLHGVEIVEISDIYEQMSGRIPVEYIEDHWFLFSNGFYLLSKEYVQKLKRLSDMVVSGIILLFSAPLMAITALAIRIDSPGPVLYQQKRVGKGSKIFTVNKFRSMCMNAEAEGAVWAQKRDPRITRVGRWIRLFRIDELPQLWNVFTGDMTLVGPRPERPEFVKELESKIPYYGVRHTVSPGITGWAQIKYPYGASQEDALRKLEYDLYYIKHMSILLDVKILLRTIGVVLLGEGAR